MDGSHERSSKRRRIDPVGNPHQKPVTHSGQLDELLRFRQSILPETKLNLNHFKEFLSSISRNEDLASQSNQLQVLRKYCGDQSASSNDQIDFSDLLQTWSLAAETNNDGICTAVPATLAQFFRTISGILEFREFGLSLCHSLLKREQVKLFDRGLSASKSKDYLISPCLRLLTEMVSFDGGTMASHVFARRDVLYKRLDIILDQPNGDTEGDRRRPTMRRMALRLVIANLKFLDAVAKQEFITQLRMVRACVRGLISDGDDIVVDVLQAMESGVIEDSTVSRASKSKFLNADTLSSLAGLYDYELDPDHPDSDTRVRQYLQNLLLKACATRKGILVIQNGWYPIGYDTHLYTGETDDYIDLGLDSPQYFDDYSVTVPVKNTALSGFIQSLKPEKDTLQSQLLLQIFKSAPEMVAEYFSKKTKFVVPAGDDPLWRGHFAFLFSVTQLAVPKNLGVFDAMPSSPPPTSIVIESILPRPFDRTTLTRCFTLNDEILIMSGSRLLTVAFEKLEQTLKTYASADDNKRMWQQASGRLIEAVLQRVPKFKDVIDTIFRYSAQNESLRASLLECIATYYRILPEATSGSTFDASSILQQVIIKYQSDQMVSESNAAIIEQVSYLVTICHLANSTKWFSKSGTETLSLYTILFKYALAGESGSIVERIRSVLASVAEHAGFVTSSKLSFDALKYSLETSKKFTPSDELYLFLDNCIHRAVQKPVRYLDRIESLQQDVSDNKTLSLLACSVAEQWTFALKKYSGQKETIKTIADWIARYYNALESSQENFRVLARFRDEMSAAADEKVKGYLQKSFEKVQKKPVQVSSLTERDDNSQSTATAVADTSFKKRNVNLGEILGMPTPVSSTLEGIDRWDSKTDIELALQSGRIAKLILCSASPEEEIRRQTFQLLQNLAHVLDESTYPEKAQIYLLTGELCETIRRHGLDTPLPSVAAELGVKSLHILSDPSHKLFSKANRFILRGPAWDLKKLIPHWADKILFHESENEEAGAWTEEIEWLLQWLVDGLKTAADMEVYRRSGIWEKVLALFSHPGLRRSAKKLILTMVWRGICVGGATTLITRVGVHRWLEVGVMLDPDHGHVVRQLQEELAWSSDKEVIERWERTRPISKET